MFHPVRTHPGLFWKADERDPMGRNQDGGIRKRGTDHHVRNRPGAGVVTGITTRLEASVLHVVGYDYDENLNVKTRTDTVAVLAEQFG